MAKPSGSKGSSPTPQSVAGDASSSELANLKRLGKYEIHRAIGSGGMGTVFLAVDSGLKRQVALKVLPRDKAANPTLVKRFRSEAQAAANLRHENIVMVYEAGEANGFLYIALEFVDGSDVADIVSKRGPMPVKRSIDVIRQMGLALEHAYKQGIVHRDIKPANILIRRDGVAKLADLGLARAVDDHSDTSITRAGTTVGTIDYMSPEQARDSKAADVRSDFYSLGCTWYYMLTGEAPFPDGSMTNKLRAHAESPLPDPRAINSSVTEAVIAVIRRLTEKDPRRRYQKPAELLADLDTARVASDIVSDAILGESDDDRVPPVGKRRPSRPRPGESREDRDADDDRPRARGAVSEGGASIPGWKPPRQERPERPPSSELARAIVFYSVVVLLGAGVLAGIGWLVQQFGTSVDAPGREIAGNPFMAGDPATNIADPQGNPLQGEASKISGTASATDDRTRSITGTLSNPGQTIDGQANATRIGPEGEPARGRVIVGGEPDREGKSIVGSSTTVSKGPEGTTAAKTSSTEARSGRTGSAGGRNRPTPAAAAAAEKRRASEDAQLPSWAAAASPPGDMSKDLRLYVRRGVSENGRFPTLNGALEQVPAEGAIIHLEGAGPFPLTPIRIEGKRRVVIQSDDGLESGEPPLVVLLSGGDSSSGGMLEFVNTAVEWRNVHVAHTAGPTGLAAGRALLDIHGGSLSLRNCSLTSIGGETQNQVAIRFRGAGESQSRARSEPMRVLIDQTVIRGDRLTALDVDAPSVELVVRRSLLWSENAVAVQLADRATGSTGLRNLRFASTTLCSSLGALRVVGESALSEATSIEWINSLVAAPEGASTPILCLLEGANTDQQQRALGTTLNWKSVDTLYLGWKPLLRLEPAGIDSAADVGDWLRAWKEKSAGSAAQFQGAAWPPKMFSGITRASVLDRLSPDSVGMHAVKTSEGGWPGCAPEWLTIASLTALEDPFATANRPQLPAGLFGSRETGESIRVDLTKDDLGKFFADRKPPQGALVVASGFGARACSPIVVQNAWVRLRFEQTEGAPLVLSPRGAESNRSGDAGPSAEAFITVQSGGLEITGGAFTIPAGDRPQIPRWFVQAIDSDIALRGCRVQGPLFASSRNKGLVQWTRTGGALSARPFAGALEGYAAFENCCLFGSGTLIEADLSKRALFFRNCVLASRDDLLALQLRGAGPEIAGSVDFETTTLSAAGNFLKVTAAPLDAPATTPVSVFADRCVFAPPLHSGANKPEPTLLACGGQLLGMGQFAWFENHCGYAPDITTFLRDDSVPAEPQEFRDVWLKQWGTARVIAPLTGADGVVLAKELPQRTEERTKLEPTDFVLHATSRAATWDQGERPIGAPLTQLQYPPIRPISGGAPSKSKGSKSTKPAPPRKVKPAF